tara:strand:- start:45 stop:461 length:417 start_codon:yes stop_codon:yes gene_type:complete
MDIDEILSALENDNHKDLLYTSLENISKDKNDILQQLQLKRENLKTMHSKLKNYRYIEELNHLKYGQYLRWINIKNPDNIYLTNGGIFLDLKLLDTGTHVVCKNNIGKIFQFKLDECIVFQKLSDQEQIILKVFQHFK